MPIEFNCIHCGEPLVEADNLAGLRSRCSNCLASIIVPGLPASAHSDVVLESPDDWTRFARGSKWVIRGLWLEFIGLLSYCVIGEFSMLEIATGESSEWLKSPAISIALVAWQLLATSLVVFGRYQMVRLPRRTGASPVLIGSLVLAVIRWSLLLAATILIARNPKGDFNSFACVFLAVLAGLLAEVTVLPGLAVAGGALRSLDIRRRVGVVSALLQGVAVLYLILLALLFFTDPISDPRNVTNQRQPAALRNAAAREAERLEMAQRIMAVIPVVCGIGLAYTWLHASLYSACRRVAGATSIPSPEPRT